METSYWPLSFEETNLAGNLRITADDIVSYAFPPGLCGRYTADGWFKARVLQIPTPEYESQDGNCSLDEK